MDPGSSTPFTEQASSLLQTNGNSIEASSSASTSTSPEPSTSTSILNGDRNKSGSSAAVLHEDHVHTSTDTLSTNTAAAAVDGSSSTAIVCNGCRLSLEETSDSVVVSFGDGLWHVDCRCAKCNCLVEHDTNLLLLADGSPVCESCSYVCSFCGLSISNEAIVTGDESYHADCFRCKACSARIEELVFAKTSQGIYCMACHNERVARTRKHAESKRNRSLRRNQRQQSATGSTSTQAAGPSSSRSRSGQSFSARPDTAPAATSPQFSSSGIVNGTSPNTGSGDHLLGTATSTSQPTSSYFGGQSIQGNSQESTIAGTSPSETMLNVASAPSRIPSTSPSAGSKGSTSPLPEPPVSLKKLRGMDKSPRIGGGDSQYSNTLQHNQSNNLGNKGTGAPPSTAPGLALVDEEGISSSAAMGDNSLLSRSTPLPGRKGGDVATNATSPYNNGTTSSSRPGTSGDTPSASSNQQGFLSLNISRSVSPAPSSRSPSPILPSTSPTASSFAAAQTNGGLSAPRSAASRNANRRSGFYGVMSMPSVNTSPTDSGTATPITGGGADDIHIQHLSLDDNDAVHPDTSIKSRTEALILEEEEEEPDEVLAQDKILPVQPLAIVRPPAGKAEIIDASSSSLSSVTTSAAGSSSSLSIPSTQSDTPQSLSASSSIAPRKNHMSFYDPDVLVFLDAVHADQDTASHATSKAVNGSAPAGRGLASDALGTTSTPTRPPDSAKSVSSMIAQDGYNSDATLDTTIRDDRRASDRHSRSRSLSPNLDRQSVLTPSPRQPRDLNLVANGHLSSFSNSTMADDDEEQEMLSPSSARRRSSGLNGLGGPKSSRSTQRSQISPRSMEDDPDDDGDDTTRTALRKVRESIRQSRGASMASSAGDSRDGRGSGMTLDIELVEVLIKELEQTKNRMKELQKNYNAIRRASRQAFEGFSMAREEYDREVQARRDAEFEMMQLKKELKEQAAKLAALNEAQAQHAKLERQSHDLRSSVVGIETELRKMKVQRDMTFAEIEELNATGKSEKDATNVPERLSTALDARLTSVKETYRLELEKLASERDELRNEVEELKQAKELFTEEGTELNKRNANISEDLTEASKRLENLKAEAAAAQKQLSNLNEQVAHAQQTLASSAASASPAPQVREKALPPPTVRSNSGSKVTQLQGINSGRDSPAGSVLQLPLTQTLPSVETHSAAVVHKIDHVAPQATVRKFKWGSKKGLERPPVNNASISKHPNLGGRPMANELSARQHSFQPISILRPVRCESCGDKMWGMGEQRCQACGIYCHSKCVLSFNIICNSAVVIEEPESKLTTMTMFGNDLVAQCLNENRLVPILVVKCIEAVEASGMQHEGIYRKSGGMGQTKLISACFDRGDAFDLSDPDRFNDISAVTSVLKNYFRNLPNPLFTFEFHQDFCSLASIREAETRLTKLENLLHSLPEQHFATLKVLMMHLNRIHRSSGENKMTPANLGVVFGPTLLRSPDPSQEFSQMHLKARVVELTVENAPQLFSQAFSET